MKPRRPRSVMAFLAMVALSGCVNAVVGSGGGSLEGPPWGTYCDARADACGIDASVCKDREACGRALLRDDIEGPLFACLSTECDQDACFAEIRELFDPTAKGQAFLSAWQAYIAACPDGNDDVELAGWIVADDVLGDFQACAEAPSCAEADECFQAAHEVHVDACEGWF